MPTTPDSYEVSIHALTRRATDLAMNLMVLVVVSIHALTRRATILESSKKTVNKCFNPRPHAEGDMAAERYELSERVSIHALTRRATF